MNDMEKRAEELKSTGAELNKKGDVELSKDWPGTGKKTKKYERKANVNFHVMLTAETAAALDEKIKAAGMTRTKYFAHLVALDGKSEPAPGRLESAASLAVLRGISKALGEIQTELRRSGNNLNQALVKSYYADSTDTTDKIVSAIADRETTLASLQATLRDLKDVMEDLKK